MRLVDADLMCARVKPYNISDEKWSVSGGTSIRLMHTLIKDAPTVDAVAVTRCKNDCEECEQSHFANLKIISFKQCKPYAKWPQYITVQIGETGECAVYEARYSKVHD